MQLQAVVWLFYGGFGAVASSLLSGSGSIDIGLVDIDSFVSVSSSIFTRSFAVVLGLICTFCTKIRSFLGDGMTATWSHGVYTCVLLFVQMNVVPSGVWKLLLKISKLFKVTVNLVYVNF